MANSILTETKQMLGIPATDVVFDIDIVILINSAFMVLNQMGVGPETPFSIDDSIAEWDDFLTEISTYQAVKSYIYLSVRLVFDPPGTSFLIDSLARTKQELEWRLAVQVPIPPEVIP